ncbi:MAG: helix-turn-helix domain-containing protein [Bacteriovoracia bacterium]
MAKKFDSKSSSKKTGNAKRLYEIRKKRGWSQQELAKEFYVTPGAVANWELGQREVPGPVIRLIEIYEEK